MKITYILAKNSTKIAATRNALFDTNMHQIFVGWGFAANPTGGTYSAPQTP